MDHKEDEEEEEGVKVVNEAVEKIGEYFDTVRIFVTKYRGEDSSTFHYSNGAGNYQAQYGQVKLFVIRQEEAEREEEREDR